jgi:hypothetical protein
MPRGVAVVLVQSEHRTIAEEHDAFSGLASLATGESCVAAVNYGARGPGRVACRACRLRPLGATIRSWGIACVKRWMGHSAISG